MPRREFHCGRINGGSENRTRGEEASTHAGVHACVCAQWIRGTEGGRSMTRGQQQFSGAVRSRGGEQGESGRHGPPCSAPRPCPRVCAHPLALGLPCSLGLVHELGHELGVAARCLHPRGCELLHGGGRLVHAAAALLAPYDLLVLVFIQEREPRLALKACSDVGLSLVDLAADALAGDDGADDFLLG